MLLLKDRNLKARVHLPNSPTSTLYFPVNPSLHPLLLQLTNPPSPPRHRVLLLNALIQSPIFLIYIVQPHLHRVEMNSPIPVGLCSQGLPIKVESEVVILTELGIEIGCLLLLVLLSLFVGS